MKRLRAADPKQKSPTQARKLHRCSCAAPQDRAGASVMIEGNFVFDAISLAEPLSTLLESAIGKSRAMLQLSAILGNSP
jgi:hypothetical protein